MEEIVRPELAMLSCVGVLITHNDQLTTNFNGFFEPLSSYFFPSFEPLVRYIIVFLFFLNISIFWRPNKKKLQDRCWKNFHRDHPCPPCCQGAVGSLSSAGKPLGCFFHVDGSAELKVGFAGGQRAGGGVERLRVGGVWRLCVSGGFGWLTVGLIGTVKIKFKE